LPLFNRSRGCAAEVITPTHVELTTTALPRRLLKRAAAPPREEQNALVV
jgi:hypothetical protein